MLVQGDKFFDQILCYFIGFEIWRQTAQSFKTAERFRAREFNKCSKGEALSTLRH